MGVNLTPIMLKRTIRLEELRGKSLAVDANNALYQFLSLIRTPDGTPLKDSEGNVTSHLIGLMFRSTRLIHDYMMDLVFVFDGEPPQLKIEEIVKRRRIREKALLEWRKALRTEDYATAFSKAVMTSRLTRSMVDDAQRLLGLLGVPFVQAPGEAEAQAAFMARRGDVWALSSRDYDSLLFGTPRLVRYLTIGGKKFLPSKRASRPLNPELIHLNNLLAHHKLTLTQLIDIAILIGTDFNKGVRGIGPITALKLLRKHGRIENLPREVRTQVSYNYNEVREVFLKPKVTPSYVFKYGDLNVEGLYNFLCDQRDFSKDRVKTVIQRMEKFHSGRRQVGLKKWFDHGLENG